MGRRKAVPAGKNAKAPARASEAPKKRGRPPKSREMSHSEKMEKGEKDLGDTPF